MLKAKFFFQIHSISPYDSESCKKVPFSMQLASAPVEDKVEDVEAEENHEGHRQN